MNNIVDNVKNKMGEISAIVGEKVDDLQERFTEKKFVHDLKSQMKEGLREEKKLAKKSYEIAKKTGEGLKSEVKDQLRKDKNSLQ